ncbi:T9SS type A sorting domain-containing protein [Bacteroidales bacterium OttesenSCG-928-B11]|nr:T9SS type A sorting domain-containing protein [Bacteroidales bacterium OttesenSCG-928-B11]
MKKKVLLVMLSAIFIYGRAQKVSAIISEVNLETEVSHVKLYTSPFRDGLTIGLPEIPTRANSKCSWITEQDTMVLLTTNYSQVQLWKNGEIIDISGEEFGSGAALFVDEDDIYVLWNKYYSYPDYAVLIWKNGETYCEIRNQDHIIGYSIAVADSNLYVAGYSIISAISRTKYHATLWTNGVAQYLSEPYGSGANSVFVSDSNVYVVGWGTDYYAKTRAKIWINGVEENLTAGEYIANANSVYVEGGDVYVTGDETIGKVSRPRVWKNGVMQNLSSQGGIACCVRPFEGDLYVGGILNDMAIIWKNGVMMNDFSKLCAIGYVMDLFIFPDSSSKVNDFKQPLFNATLYPNPATHHVTIDMPSNIPSAQFSLFDMYGRLLLQKQVQNGEKINLPNLSSGVYLYQVDSEKGRATGKVVVSYE